jgi:hypothetical protein
VNFIKKTPIYLALLITILLLANCTQEQSIGIKSYSIDSVEYGPGIAFTFNHLPPGFVSLTKIGDIPTKISYIATFSDPSCNITAITSVGSGNRDAPTSGNTYYLNVGAKKNGFLVIHCSGAKTDVDTTLSINFIAKGVTYKGFVSASIIPS